MLQSGINANGSGGFIPEWQGSGACLYPEGDPRRDPRCGPDVSHITPDRFGGYTASVPYRGGAPAWVLAAILALAIGALMGGRR